MTSPSAAARSVMEFANSVDVEAGTDELASPDALGQWLHRSGLAPAPCAVTAQDHAQAVRLRTAVRDLLDADGPRVPTEADADAALWQLPLRVSLAALRPGATGGVLVADRGLAPVRAALAELAAALATVLVTGEVARVKRCHAHDCAWVFWDSSKNRSRRWCSMRVCGNRAKARRYAARQR
ncbi:CGNR zinc finger domain-containing protein [Actinokineospora sp. G85]|uniref:CGNR zinc finger domain-containing protein n=1 Tax=Actinokineospora sp. G85 TaxID=3406626 RepID=UPI003C71C9B3